MFWQSELFSVWDKHAVILSTADSCRRPTGLHDRTRDSDEEDIRDRDYDVAALATNLSEAFRYGIYNNADIEEVNLEMSWQSFFYSSSVKCVWDTTKCPLSLYGMPFFSPSVDPVFSHILGALKHATMKLPQTQFFHVRDVGFY